MKGLEISVTNSDLVVKQEERLVKLFVIFKDNKYGTKYVIFTDNVSSELYYGSPLVNGNKMVIMKFKDIKDEELVKQFIWNYLNDNSTSGFEMFEIPSIDKLEIIDSNTLEVKDEYIDKLNDIFFKKEEVVENTTEQEKEKKKSIGPVLFLFILIFAGVGGFLYLKNNPELIYGKDIYVQCRINYNVSELGVTANENIILTFSNSQVMKKHEKEIIYIFNDNDKYYEFKEKNLSYQYLSDSGEEKYIDNELSYKLFVNYNLNDNYTLPKDYDEIYSYYQNKNYSCSNI